jgi:hypothetical protein
MSVFLTDLWQDLREKRLAPVAVLLAVALVAVPIVMLKPASGDSGEDTPAPAAAQAPGLPSVEAVDVSGKGSDLGVFDPKDPFQPRGAKRGKESGDGIAQLVGGSSTSTLPGTTTSQTGGGSGDASLSPAGPGSDPYSNNPVEDDGSSGTDPVEDDQKPTTTYYTYVVDVNFGVRGSERKRKGVRRLDLLPNSGNPLLVFLGVSSDRKKAVFLADSTVSQAGEGKCKPSIETCTFVHLSLNKTQDEHYFTDEAGREFVLKLLDIRRVKVEAKKSATASANDPLFADDAANRREKP